MQNSALFPKKLWERKQPYSMEEWVMTYQRSKLRRGWKWQSTNQTGVKWSREQWDSREAHSSEQKLKSLNTCVKQCIPRLYEGIQSKVFAKATQERTLSWSRQPRALEVRIWGQIYCKKNASTESAFRDIVYNHCGSSLMRDDCRENFRHWAVQIVARSSWDSYPSQQLDACIYWRCHSNLLGARWLRSS